VELSRDPAQHGTVRMACWALLLVGSVGGFRELPIMSSAMADAGQIKSRDTPATIFRSVLLQIKKKTHVPVLLPNALPEGFRKAELCATASADASSYSISLDYGCPPDGNASFAGTFEGTLNENNNLLCDQSQGEKRVKLARGVEGCLSCSCAPANIWWRENKGWYHFQIHMWGAPASKRQEKEQERAMTALANSAILAGPR
jgi:hypothetical protein